MYDNREAVRKEFKHLKELVVELRREARFLFLEEADGQARHELYRPRKRYPAHSRCLPGCSRECVPAARLAATGMTLEQRQQWKEMAGPLVERFTGERWEAEKALLTLMPHEDRIDRINGLCKSGKLVRLGVPRPIWALRFAFLTWSYELFTEPWFPRFALRSATALLGLALAHPDDEARAALFQRVHIRFVRESLRPFVEWLSQLPPGDARKGSYASLMDLSQVCEDSRSLTDPEKWRKFNARLRFYDEPVLESERGRCLHLTEVLVKSVLIQLNVELDTERIYWRPQAVPYTLHQQHQWRLEGRASDEFYSGPNCTHLIVAPFLAALEAECPPPDWLEPDGP